MKIPPPPSSHSQPVEWIDDSAPHALEALGAPRHRSGSATGPLAFAIALLVGLGVGFWLRDHQSAADTTIVIANQAVAPRRAAIVVHVTGRVHHSGVYQLPEGARVRDAIDRAGGTLPDGDADALNLAARVEDGRKIEVPPRAAPTAISIRRTAPPSVETSRPRATAASKYFGVSQHTKAQIRQPEPKFATKPSPSAARPSPSAAKPSTPLDLNRASATELEALPGIGPSLAGRIIAFREQNGGFQSVDDLDAVDGIGEKRLETLRPLVEVR